MDQIKVGAPAVEAAMRAEGVQGDVRERVLRRLFASGPDGVLSPDAAGGLSDGSDRVEVRVSLLFGDEAVIALPNGGTERFPAAWVAEQVGVGTDRVREELPGMRLVALVEEGQLVGFRRA